MNRSIVASVACLLVAASTQAFGQFSQTVDDVDAVFSSWNGALQVAADPTAYGGSYRYILDWGNSGNASALVRYQLSGVPAGNNLYHVSFSSPTNAAFGTPGSIAQWHIFNAAADGTTNFAQAIPWAGQFGTNKQWLGPNQGYNPGAFTLLGPGPQSDVSSGDGDVIWLNGSGSGAPYIYIEFQPWYNAPIAFDAINVTQIVPEPSSIVLSVLGAAGLGMVAWRRRRTRRA